MNEWEKLFSKTLKMLDFGLGKDEEGYFLTDYLGANPGNIEADRFDTPEGIVDRMGIYWKDYLYDGLEREFHEDGYVDSVPCTDEEWYDFMTAYPPFIKKHQFEFNIIDMFCNHLGDIALENCIDE